MDPSDPAGAIEARPTHRRWVGVLLSLLIAGAGIFLAGDRKAGLRWFLGLAVLSFVAVAVAPLPAIPGLGLFVVLAVACVVLSFWMLARSWKPVPKLGVRGWLWFLLLAAILSGLEGVVPLWFVRAFKVPTGSMEPTVLPGDHLFVQTSAYWFGGPSRAELVVFRTDALDASGVPKGQYYVKRVVGLPGEAIRITGGRLLINDRPLQSPALFAGTNFNMQFRRFPPGETDSYVVPAGSCFVVGDNVTNSLDSRHYGAVPRKAIIGRATKIYWPFARLGDIR